MNVQTSVTVDAPAEIVWAVVTDFENAANTISGIDEVEVLERPTEGIVGLKWKETRTMAGKKAVETMWITDAQKESYYDTEARSHGAIYRTRIALEERGGGTELSMSFSAEPVSFGAKLLGLIFGTIMKGSLRKALLKDLQDIKAVAESRASRPEPA